MNSTSQDQPDSLPPGAETSGMRMTAAQGQPGTLTKMGADQAVIELQRLGYPLAAARSAVADARALAVPDGGPAYIGTHQVRLVCGGFRIEPGELAAGAAPWPDLSRDQDLSEILAAVTVTGRQPAPGLDELGDRAVAAMSAIQAATGDADVTWSVFTDALGRALARVPDERPAP